MPPKGSFDGPRQSFTIGANDQIFSADAYKPIIVAYKNGAPIRLGDLGQNHRQRRERATRGLGRFRNGEQPAVLLDIQRQPGANIIRDRRPRESATAQPDRDAAPLGAAFPFSRTAPRRSAPP